MPATDRPAIFAQGLSSTKSSRKPMTKLTRLAPSTRIKVFPENLRSRLCNREIRMTNAVTMKTVAAIATPPSRGILFLCRCRSDRGPETQPLANDVLRTNQVRQVAVNTATRKHPK